MGGLKSLVERLYINKLNPETVRQIVLPAGQGVQVTANAAGDTYGDWEDLALAADVTADTLIVGVALEDPSAVDVYTVDIGSCLGYANAAAVIAAGAAAIAAAHRAEVREWFSQSSSPGAGTGSATDVTADVLAGASVIALPFPVWIPSGVGILARCYGHTAAAVTIRVSVLCVQNF